ncbi:phosphonate monoester hydrolase [Nitzschia inconspicua]|uniref:Phosphonate monoester hydrolase n=1 Tax=Nitzschia inconspicua TaxID=303405 RepID=A0A9K3PSK8_9STRA|nr:phosphonate monoester hydrolase [Nitzschia inconspicua]
MTKLRFLPSIATLLLLAAVLICNFPYTHATNSVTRSCNNARTLQQEEQVVIRGPPFHTHQELMDAVDVYLDYHYAGETAKQPNITTEYQRILSTYGPLEYWDVGRLDNFANLFNAQRNPLAAVATPNLSQWNVGQNVEIPVYLQDMFLGASLVNFDVSFWKTDLVIHFNGMFENAVSFEGIGLETWNVANGKLFMSMFSGCISLHQDLDLSSWQLRSAERLDAMFRNSSFGGAKGGDLCTWNNYLRTIVTVKDMFLQSKCISMVDPNLAERNDPNAELSICSPCDKSTIAMKPNILLIVADQMRFDMIRHVQDELEHYADVYKIQTPNLDRLLQSGAYFRNAYCQCAVCAPARTTLRTGCTIERTGVQHNDLAEEFMNNPFYEERVHELESLDHVLAEKMGYVSEYYGKWHMPQPLIESRDGSRRNVVQYNDFDYSKDEPFYLYDADGRKYKRYLESSSAGPVYFKTGEQMDPFSGYPYTPIQLDARYGMPTNTALTTDGGLPRNRVGQPNVLGMSALDEGFTPSFFTGDITKKAIQRLQQHSDPWFVTASFHSPHPPFVASWKNLEKYWTNQEKLFVPRNLNTDGHMDKSAYDTITEQIPEYGDVEKLQEWTALYYALIEEVDEQVGEILDQVEYDVNNTLVIFTSDHGEMLGAHNRREKNTFYEESSRVPLLISWPGKIPQSTVVDEMASHLDIFATILDYAGGSEHDKSDGTSLRRFIEGGEINSDYEEDVVFAEWDYRKPINKNVEDAMDLIMDRQIDDRPSFLVRHKQYKLMMQKVASTNQMDMMFDIFKDPFEIDNLLSPDVAMVQDDTLIAKAEHLRCLLLHWMERLDGESHYFSDPTANHGGSAGDIPEIRNRQRWKQIGFWVSDSSIDFGRISWNGNAFVRHEHLYMGTRKEQSVEITDIVIEGSDAQYFQISRTNLKLRHNGCARVRVSFMSSEAVWRDKSLDATFVMTVKLGASTTKQRIPLKVPQSHSVPNLDSSSVPSKEKPSSVEEGSQADSIVIDGEATIPTDISPFRGGDMLDESRPELPARIRSANNTKDNP